MHTSRCESSVSSNDFTVADYCVFEITFFEVGNNTCTRMQKLMLFVTARGLRCTVLPSPFFDSTFPAHHRVFAESFAGIGKRQR